MCVSSHWRNDCCCCSSGISSVHTPLRYVIGLVPSRQSLPLFFFAVAHGIKSCHLSERNRHATLPPLVFFSSFPLPGAPFNCLTSILGGKKEAK